MINARSRAHRILSSMESYTPSSHENLPDLPAQSDILGEVVGLYQNLNADDDIWIFEYGAYSKSWPVSFLQYKDISVVDLHGEKSDYSFYIVLKTKIELEIKARNVSDRLELSRFFSRISEDFGHS